jgi:hypothetical protein
MGMKWGVLKALTRMLMLIDAGYPPEGGHYQTGGVRLQPDVFGPS